MPDQGTFNLPYQIPKEVLGLLPKSGGQDYLSALDQIFGAQEKQQMEKLLGNQESRGLYQSGDTQKKIVEDVLGPSLARRQAAVFPLVQQGEQQTYETQQESTRFQQQRQFASEQFQRQLQAMQEQASLQRDLMTLQHHLEVSSRPGFGENFMNNLGSSLGSSLGNLGAGAAKGLTGSVTGGLGGGGYGGGLSEMDAFMLAG